MRRDAGRDGVTMVTNRTGPMAAAEHGREAPNQGNRLLFCVLTAMISVLD